MMEYEYKYICQSPNELLQSSACDEVMFTLEQRVNKSRENVLRRFSDASKFHMTKREKVADVNHQIFQVFSPNYISQFSFLVRRCSMKGEYCMRTKEKLSNETVWKAFLVLSIVDMTLICFNEPRWFWSCFSWSKNLRNMIAITVDSNQSRSNISSSCVYVHWFLSHSKGQRSVIYWIFDLSSTDFFSVVFRSHFLYYRITFRTERERELFIKCTTLLNIIEMDLVRSRHASYIEYCSYLITFIRRALWLFGFFIVVLMPREKN